MMVFVCNISVFAGGVQEEVNFPTAKNTTVVVPAGLRVEVLDGTDYGVHSMKEYYDNAGNLVRRESYGVDGKLTLNKHGYAILESEYDSAGNMTRQATYGVDGKLTLNNDGWAILEREFDSAGNCTRDATYGVDGKLTYDSNTAEAEPEFVVKEMKLPTEPNSEEDFDVTITDDGTGARVIGYKGKSGGVYIPATIQGLPVKEVEFKITATEPTYVNALVVSDGCEKVYIGGYKDTFGGGVKDTYEGYYRTTNDKDEPYYALRDANRESVEKIAPKGFELGLIKLPDSIIGFNLEGTAITEFEVPASVKVVGRLPETLEKVSFRGVPEAIGGGAFARTKLTSIVIPEGVEGIGKRAFAESKNLKTVTLPTGLEVIEQELFDGCESLKKIVIPEGVKIIDTRTFHGSSLESVTLPSTLKTIGNEAFLEVSTLKELIIPESINSIEFPEVYYSNANVYGGGYYSNSAFWGCSRLNLAAQARLRKLGYDDSF